MDRAIKLNSFRYQIDRIQFLMGTQANSNKTHSPPCLPILPRKTFPTEVARLWISLGRTSSEHQQRENAAQGLLSLCSISNVSKFKRRGKIVHRKVASQSLHLNTSAPPVHQRLSHVYPAMRAHSISEKPETRFHGLKKTTRVVPTAEVFEF